MIGRGLKQLGFKPNVDFICQDDGEGPYVAEWLSQTPQPAMSDILAAAEQSPAPESVTPWQAREALRLASLLSAVDAHIDTLGTDSAAYIAWHYAERIRRNSPFVSALALAFGLTDVQLDAIFTTAAGLSL